MAELITKSNAFRMSHKEKLAERIKLDEQMNLNVVFQINYLSPKGPDLIML